MHLYIVYYIILYTLCWLAVLYLWPEGPVGPGEGEEGGEDDKGSHPAGVQQNLKVF